MSKHLAPGEIFAGYRIERVLGRGGMGAVYLAAHPRLPRHDALKVMARPAAAESSAADAESSARFKREAELVARLEHPNIVPVHDRGTEDGCHWIAMGFVDGIDAAELIRRHPGGVAPDTAVHIVTAVARGLDEAHRIGVLHRDVKPANILIESHAGQPDRVFVSDFGIARTVTDAEHLTEAGTVVATLSYAAPELLAGQTVDHRVDVYALGCTLYELLTGAKPFPQSSPAAVVRAHLTAPPPRPSARNRALPTAIDGVISRALAKDPQHRYDSCSALAAAAAAALHSGPVDRGGWTVGGWRKPGLVAAVLTVVVALIAAVVVTRQGDSSASSPASSPAVPPTTLSAASTTTSTITRLSWGAYEFVVQALPRLLPPTPTASGYQGIRCGAVDTRAERIAITAPLGERARLRCGGNGNPVDWIFVGCDIERRPLALEMPTDTTYLGGRTWANSSGQGRLAWGTTTGQYGRSTGVLVIAFDDDARNFCELVVMGGTTGYDLIDSWWNNAPV